MRLDTDKIGGLNLLSTSVLIVDVNGMIEYVNAACESLLGRSNKILFGFPVSSFLPKAREWIGSYKKNTSSLFSVRAELTELILRPGALVQVYASVHPLPEEEQLLIIELQPAKNSLLLNHNKHMNDLSENTRRLLRNLAHEIKNPLGGIRGAAQLLEFDLKDEEQKEYTRVVISEADRLQGLVDKLLAPYRHRLTPLEVTFLFYYCNLRHIMWYNSEIFKGFIHYVFDTSKVQIDPNVTADDIFKQDETVLAITTVGLAKEFNNYSIKIIVEEHPELIPKVVAYCKSIEKKVHMLDLLFDTFVNTDADVPEVRKKQMTWRNTVIISDTDSEIFTAAEWDDWYRGGIHYDITDESYQITSLVIYWLHHSVRHACYRYSILHGVSPEHRRVLAMKNEFLYPIMLLFGIKKTYCGIQAVQEGVILPKPKADIKGQTLRGSSICSTSLDFIQNFIENDVLYPSIQGKLSANKLIDKVLGWCSFFDERRI